MPATSVHVPAASILSEATVPSSGVDGDAGSQPGAGADQKKAWGGAKPAAAASLRSIQEQEKVGHTRQTSQVSNTTNLHSGSPGTPGGRGPGWNVPQAQTAKPLKDIMQEDAQIHAAQPRPVQGANMSDLSRMGMFMGLSGSMQASPQSPANRHGSGIHPPQQHLQQPNQLPSLHLLQLQQRLSTQRAASQDQALLHQHPNLHNQLQNAPNLNVRPLQALPPQFQGPGVNQLQHLQQQQHHHPNQQDPQRRMLDSLLEGSRSPGSSGTGASNR